MAALVVPMRAPLFPTIGNPVIAAAFADPTSGNPDVLMPAPLPKSRCPDVSDARRRHGLDANRRGGHIDIDHHSCRRHGGCGTPPRGQHQAPQQRLTRSPPSILLLYATSVPT